MFVWYIKNWKIFFSKIDLLLVVNMFKQAANVQCCKELLSSFSLVSNMFFSLVNDSHI
jgi:hypothetical protein